MERAKHLGQKNDYKLFNTIANDSPPLQGRGNIADGTFWNTIISVKSN